MRVSEREVGADQEQRGECATPAITATGDDNRETDRRKNGTHVTNSEDVFVVHRRFKVV